MRTSRKPTPLGQGSIVGPRAGETLLFLLLSVSLTCGQTAAGSPTPPPAPQVAPVISGTYASDLNGNHIADSLDTAPGGVLIAPHEQIEVELIFNAPITQAQIDEFLRRCGPITYIYQAISYGWNGFLQRQSIAALPSVMGPALVQVEPVHQLRPYMDLAGQTGRVRPIWKAGFAGNPAGFSGDPNTTIACVGGGVDATHRDLKGRCVYWHDFSKDNEPTPVDFDGHETLVAGVASGTGDASGVNAGDLKYTYVGHGAGSDFETDPIWLPTGCVATIKSVATWTGGSARLFLRWRPRGPGIAMWPVTEGTSAGTSPLVLTNSYTAYSNKLLEIDLVGFDTIKDVVINTTVSPYPTVGDGFNKLRGVAPGCKWAAAKVYDRDGYAWTTQLAAAMDDLVLHRKDKNIKVMNLSQGLTDGGFVPVESTSLRDKVNTVVKNGIVVVAAAGNNANYSTESDRKMADPARAAQAITVGATGDENTLTDYSNYGFNPPLTNLGEDFKPDVVAPGGSWYYTGIMSVDSGTSDGVNADKEPNDYASSYGTSLAAPFVAGSAALVIQALERQGVRWDFNSPSQPRYIKMLLCATASETNATRDAGPINLGRRCSVPSGTSGPMRAISPRRRNCPSPMCRGKQKHRPSPGTDGAAFLLPCWRLGPEKTVELAKRL